MKTILLINRNKSITNDISRIVSDKFKIVSLERESYIIPYIEEYMPSYIILNPDIHDFETIVSYINKNTEAKLIIAGSYRKSAENSCYKHVCVSEIRSLEDLEQILNIIDEIEAEENPVKEEYKFIPQQVISFYSVQGGVGKTTLAFNLAWFLKNLDGARVLIVDLNFCEGPSDLTVKLNLSSSPNLGFFIEKISNEEEAFLNSMVSIRSGIDVLQPPLSLCQSDRFNIDMLGSLVYLARRNYNFIIADVPFRYDNICLEMLNLSTISFLVLWPFLGSVLRGNSFGKFLPANQRKGIIFNLVRDEEVGNLKEFEEMLNLPLVGIIPHFCKEERKFIRDGNEFFEILDFQQDVSKLAKYVI
ncbi:MAG: AAA family ATPase [Actinobacteria bacterium]|nr:AAA family ATPase [Actinomycetota bacterium]